jgi:hypothetical protein
MKKFASIVLLFVTVLTAQAQENTSLEDINKGWGTKTINNVINGSFGIMLERFDQTWPTWMVGLVRETMEKGLSEEVLDEETELTVTVDSKNGFVCVGDAGTDGEYMSACYWNRPNGHKLLAVLLGKPTDPCIEVLCTYDYDPQKKALIPEPSILKGYRWGDKGEFNQILCDLPRTGKNVKVEDWSGEDGPVVHTFTWDGTKPVYAKTEPLVYDDGLADIPVSFRGAQPNVKDFVAALLASNTGESMNGLREAWKFFKNGMKQMPGDDLIVDTRNGYVGYNSIDEAENARQVIECCIWNYADKKHKLVAVSNDDYLNGKPIVGQFSGLEFYIYDNAARTMKVAYAQDLGAEIDVPAGETVVSHALPRVGKTIIYTIHTASGKIQKRLTWNGSKFIPESK